MSDLSSKSVYAFRHLALLCLSVLLVACAFAPPIQEMSNARQTIQAAKDARAQQYAPEPLEIAERMMREATELLENGAYQRARESAIAAQQYAIKAQQQALSSQRE